MITNKIEAKELRINNLINHADRNGNIRVVTVESIHERGINVTGEMSYDCPYIEAEYSYDDMSAILLTDGWAVKFGYENTVEMAVDLCDESKFHVKINGIDLRQMKVHEAQNLWHSLTGQELEFKTKEG